MWSVVHTDWRAARRHTFWADSAPHAHARAEAQLQRLLLSTALAHRTVTVTVTHTRRRRTHRFQVVAGGRRRAPWHTIVLAPEGAGGAGG